MEGVNCTPPMTAPGRGNARRVVEQGSFLLALVLLGLILALSAKSERPTGERVGRRLELVDLIAEQQRRTAGLEAEAAALEEQVADYQNAIADARAVPSVLQRDVDEISLAAGLTDVRGPGVTVTLEDSTLPIEQADAADVNDLVIHEQDLQAVVNAMWAGGAEAVSVNGQRVLTTSAVRCVGNILLMNGRVHPPPYVIAAIGDQRDLAASLERDASVARFREASARYQLGYTAAIEDAVTVASFVGPPVVNVAEPVEL
jgi:uncharacterized protein YlxW (UPF0749 family)